MTESEINALVAEKIMGEPRPDDPEDLDQAENLCLAGSAIVSEKGQWQFFVYYEGHAWHPRGYTRDMNAARDMELQLENLGKPLSSRINDHPFMLYMWFLMEEAKLDKRWNNGTFTGNAHSFYDLLKLSPMQRCVAALKAVGVEV